jgi:2-haloacid dehalogenase
MPAIDTVVFDIGNVFLRWDPRHLYRKLFDDEVRMEWFLENVCTPAWNIEQDRGRPFAEAVSALVTEHPDWAEAIRAYDERWSEMVPGEVEGTRALLARLQAKGVPTYAITNFSREKFAHARQRFPFLDSFKGVVVSAHERLLKPDAAIYRLFIERYGRQPQRCLFIDDSPANVEGALAVGMNAVRFQDAATLEGELVHHGLL